MAERFIPKATEYIAPDEMGETGQGAPRPVKVGAAASEPLETLTTGEGAVIHDRAHASQTAQVARKQLHGHSKTPRMKVARRPRVKKHMAPRKKMARPVFIGICIGAAVVVTLLGGIVLAALDAPSTSLGPSTRVEQAQTSGAEGIEYDGYTYNVVQQEDGTWAFVRSSNADASSLTIFTLEGTPVTVVLYNGAFVIPENLDNTWKVMVWVNADASIPDVLTRGNEEPVQGDGSIASASLNGSNLVLNFDNNATDTIPLS